MADEDMAGKDYEVQGKLYSISSLSIHLTPIR
jgi:hypothetical protein